MRRLVILILVVAVWFAGDRIASRVLAAFLDYSSDPIAQLYAGKGRGDVVLVGNSRAYRDFDLDLLSRKFGGRVVNLALPGAPIELSEALVDDYLDRYGAPRLLIFEPSGLVQRPGAMKDLRAFMGRSARIARLLRRYFPRLYYAGCLSHLFNFNSGFALNLAEKVFRPMPDLRLNGVMSEAAAASVRSGTYFVPRKSQIASARRLIAHLRARGVNVRFVLAPVEKHYATRNRVAALRTAVQNLTGGHDLWDEIDGPPDTAAYFADYVHLNRRGVAVFMDLLRKRDFFK